MKSRNVEMLEHLQSLREKRLPNAQKQIDDHFGFGKKPKKELKKGMKRIKEVDYDIID